MTLSNSAMTRLGIALGDNGVGAEVANILNGTQGAAQTFTGGLTITTNGVTITDVDIATGTVTGTKLPKLATEKLGFFGATPIVQPANTVDYITALVNLGLRASGGTASATFPGALSAVGITTTGNLTVSAVNIVTDTVTGTQIATATTQLIAFYGATPIPQRAGAAQAQVVTTAPTNVTPYGYTQAQATAILTLLNEVQAALVVLGLIKGSA